MSSEIIQSTSSIAYIGVGSNLADRIAYVEKALTLIAQHTNIRIIAISPFYETKPYGSKADEYFINGVVKINTNLSMHLLFRYLKKVEQEVGRKQRIRWDDREIDLDILLYNNEILHDRQLTIPHKGISKRDFVLQPLIDIDEHLIHPVLQKPMTMLLDELTERYITAKLRLGFQVNQNRIGHEKN